MSTTPHILIVIPLYNEAEKIAQTVETLVTFLTRENFPYTYTIMLANNGSTDGSARVCDELTNKFDNVHAMYVPEKGKGRAVYSAWRKSDADIFSFMDADLSSDLTFFKSLIEAVAGGSCDLAIGNRLGEGSVLVSTKITRKYASLIYNAIVRLVLRTGIDDHQCGFKAISRRAFIALEPRLTDTQFFFDTELIAFARAKGLTVRQIDIRWVDSASSKVRLFKDSLGMFSSILRLGWRLRHER